MAIVFPLAFPSAPAPRSVVWRPQSVVAVTESPFSLSQQVQAHQGQRWVVEMDFPPMTRAQAEEFIALQLSLNGMEGKFLLPPFGWKTARGVPAGSPQLDITGTGSTKASPVIAGWTPSVTGLLKKGDGLQFAKNYLTRAKEFDHADWTKAGSGGGSPPTITGDDTAAPDGTITADKVDFPATGVGEVSILQQGAGSKMPDTSEQVVVASIWLRADSSIDIELSLVQTDASAFTANLTTSWQLFEITGTTDISASSLNFQIRNKVSQSAKTVYAWGANYASPQEYTLHKVLGDVNSDANGEAQPDIWPSLRHFLESSPVAFSNMTGVFRLAQNENPWDINTAMHFGISLVAMEAI